MMAINPKLFEEIQSKRNSKSKTMIEDGESVEIQRVAPKTKEEFLREVEFIESLDKKEVE